MLSDIGSLTTYVHPQGNCVRFDDGMEEGMTIPIFYDPVIAKLITYSDDRQEAIDKMIQATVEYQLTGVATTLIFCKFVMRHSAFLSGQFDTRFISLYYTPDMLNTPVDDDEAKSLLH